MEGLRILCDELTTIVLMDENTLDGFKCGFPSVVFPEPYMFVVPTHSKHFEEGLLREAHRVKKEQSLGVLPPARDRVFTDCRMIIVVLDEGRHVHVVLLWNRQHMIKDFFKFA
jgi:hypothetical protein